MSDRAGGRPARPAALAAAAALFLLAPAACTGGDAGPTPDAYAGDGPLVVVSGADLTSVDGHGVRQALIDEWNADDSHRPAVLMELPRAEDGQRSELVASLQSGSADIDVLNLDTTWIPEFAEAGLIRPLDDDLTAGRFLPQAERAGRWAGRTYAVPFNTDVGLLYYRSDLLDRLGLDVADLAEGRLGELISRLPGGQDRPMYVTQLRPYEGLTVNTLEAFWSAGVEIVDEDGDYTGDEAELLRGLAELQEITDDAKLDGVSHDADESAAISAFTDADDGALLMRNWPFAYHRAGALLPRDDTGFGVTELPGVAALGGQSLAVSATSPRAEDAEELIAFLTGREAQQRLLAAGFAPARLDAYGFGDGRAPSCGAPRSVVHPPPGPASGDSEAPPGTDGAAREAYVALLWCALSDAHPRPATEYYPAFSRTLQREVSRMLSGQASAAEVAEALHRSLPDALEGRLPDSAGRQE